MASVIHLEAHLATFGRVLLGYSGGVDSALLAVTGLRALGPERFLAVIGKSDSYPAVQYQAALQIARQFGVPLLELDTHELEDPAYRANGPDRCYFCKQELWGRLAGVAAELGFESIIDGTHADDLSEHRPGLLAAREHHIRSPLAELGWSKAMVRAAAEALGIPSWAAPAAPCLSSRIQYGLEVTTDRLRQVEEAEACLRALGIDGDLRVRHRGDRATVEVLPAMHSAVLSHWDHITQRFAALGFPAVELDPRGYRRGGLLSELPVLGG